MRDLFEQWVEAWSERIRSPVLGSLAIAFVVSNWKPLFFLLFAEAPVWLRIRYFEHHTDANSLIWYPLIVGVVAAFLIPWVTLGGAWVARFPKFLLHRLQQNEGTRREIEQLRIEAEREAARTKSEEERAKREAAEARRAADREAEIIAAGKRLKEAETVGEETKEELEADRRAQQASIQVNTSQEARPNTSTLPSQFLGDGISSHMMRAIILVLGHAESALEKEEVIEHAINELVLMETFPEITRRRAAVEFNAAFDDLRQMEMLESDRRSVGSSILVYGLTKNGYQVFDALIAQKD